MRLRLFLLSPAFPIILGTILYLVYVVYLTPVILCDDNCLTLYELKTKLTSEVANYRVSIINIEQYSDLQEQLKQISRPNFRNFNLEESYASKYHNAMRVHDQSITIINKLEASIKRIEPDFKSPLRFNNYYPRVGRGF